MLARLYSEVVSRCSKNPVLRRSKDLSNIEVQFAQGLSKYQTMPPKYLIKVLALDLERTLVSDAMNREPRPGLFDFLLFCVQRFERVVLFTAVSQKQAFAVLNELQAQGVAPTEFVSKIGYVEWDGKYKDLCFVSGVSVHEVLFVDDDPGWVAPGQESQYIAIAEYDPYLVHGIDTELQRIRAVLEARSV